MSVCHVNPAFESIEAITSVDGADEHGDGVATGSTRSVSSEDATISTNHASEKPPSYYEVKRRESTDKKPAVVVVRDGNKSYSSGVPVLSGFNMTVEKGTM